jgi:spore maturation protein CgeB
MNVRIFLIGPDFFNYTSSLERAFQESGHDTGVLTFRNFWDDCSYLDKKLERWGLTARRKKYYRDWNNQVAKAVTVFQPDAVVILNGEYLQRDVVKQFKGGNRKTVLWMLDSILRFPGVEPLLEQYDHVYSFDHRDEKYLQDKYNRRCRYLPVGYDSNIYFPSQAQVQDIDVCFIGNSTGNRIALLQKVAEYMHSARKTFYVAGRFWDERYFWKKARFARKYPPLGVFVQNKILRPMEVANIYRRSRICLNIHIDAHEGVNPRTFEILGTRSLELVDDKSKIHDLLNVGTEVISYYDSDDLINKIAFYLCHDNERSEIAESGYRKAANHFTIRQSAKIILDRLGAAK